MQYTSPQEVHNGFQLMNTKQFLNRFLDTNTNKKFVFGRNIYTDEILKKFYVDGIIDDYTDDEYYKGVPINRLSDIPKDALVVVAASSKPFSLTEILKRKGYNTVHYYEIHRESTPGFFAPLEFMENFSQHYQEHRTKFDDIYNRLADKKSKELFRKLVTFKETLEIHLLKDFELNEERQYFEDFLNFQEAHEVFYDVGGYNGHTSKIFMEECPNYESIHIFEPEQCNANTIRSKFKDNPRVAVHQIALSDTQGTVRFSSSGSTSKPDDQGKQIIATEKLDSMQIQPPTFIKMDIEGAEVNALIGASKTIRVYHPKIAVSVYHKSSDFWKIPEKILSVRDDYKLFLRHYTEGIYETVMFFIPKK